MYNPIANISFLKGYAHCIGNFLKVKRNFYNYYVGTFNNSIIKIKNLN